MKPEDIIKGADCLTPAELEAVLEGRLPEGRKHIESCPACEHELISLQEFLEAKSGAVDERDVAWIEERLRPAPPPQVRRNWLAWFPSAPLPRFAFATAAALLVIAGGLQLRHMTEPSFEDSRSTTVRSTQLRGLAPAGDLTMAPAEFQWEAVQQASVYEVQLTEVDGAPLWTERSNQTKLILPERIQQQMLPRKALLWRVRAIDDHGVVIAESAPERIRVLPSGAR